MKKTNTREIEYTEVDFMTSEERDEYFDFLYRDFLGLVEHRRVPQTSEEWVKETASK